MRRKTRDKHRVMKKIRHLFDISDLTTEEIDGIIAVAEDIMAHREKYAHACDGKKIATLFFEPSTRTRLSFEAAMLELGGSTLGFASASASSTTKGESVMDTIRTVGRLCRHHRYASSPRGRGARRIAKEHRPRHQRGGTAGIVIPRRRLRDLLTIKNRHGRLDHLVVGICGDLKYGRTVHSLIKPLSRYPCKPLRHDLASGAHHPQLRALRDTRAARGGVDECRTIEDCIAELDVLYMTRNPARALRRPQRVRAAERQLCPERREDEVGKRGYERAAPPPQSQGDQRRCGR